MTDTTYDALLFDMDGTLINSILPAERVWGAWAAAHGLDVPAFVPTVHDVRGIDPISRLNLPGVDPQAEVTAITAAEAADLAGTVPIPGAEAFLATLPRER